MRIFELMSSGPGDLFILRFWSFFKTIFSLNTIDMLLFGLMWSGKSHSVLDSLVKTLLNSFANISSCQYLSVEDLFIFWFTFIQIGYWDLVFSVLIYILPKIFVLILTWLLIFLSFSLTDLLVKCLNWLLVFLKSM